MEMKIKAPVEIIQELIAIHTTRIEMVEKCTDKAFTPAAKTSFKSAKQQSKKYTAELMSELSNFGDAVMASVDHQNEYQVMYKNALGKIDTMTPQEAEHTFQSLELALKNIYESILETKADLPIVLQEMLSKQAKGIEG